MSFYQKLFIVFVGVFVGTQILCLEKSTANSQEELIAVVALIRHGKRAPSRVILYPTYNYSDGKWPNGHSQLTDSGIVQQYSNGYSFKRRYRKVCGRPVKFEEEMMVLSSKSKRTMISSIAFLKGFLGNKRTIPVSEFEKVREIGEEDIIGYTHAFLPNIYNVKVVPDVYLRSIDVCENVRTRIKKHFLIDNAEVIHFQKSHAPLIKYILNKTGIEEAIWDHNKMVVIWDVLECEKAGGHELPIWIFRRVNEIAGMEKLYNASNQTMVVDVIKQRAIKFYTHSIRGNDTLQMYTIGLLANDIIETFENNVKRHSAGSAGVTKQFYIYMAHDFTISALMTLLNIDFNERPAFSSSLILELVAVPRRTKNMTDYIVKFLYKPNEKQVFRLNVRDKIGLGALKNEIKHRLISNETAVNEMCNTKFLFN